MKFKAIITEQQEQIKAKEIALMFLNQISLTLNNDDIKELIQLCSEETSKRKQLIFHLASIEKSFNDINLLNDQIAKRLKDFENRFLY